MSMVSSTDLVGVEAGLLLDIFGLGTVNNCDNSNEICFVRGRKLELTLVLVALIKIKDSVNKSFVDILMTIIEFFNFPVQLYSDFSINQMLVQYLMTF